MAKRKTETTQRPDLTLSQQPEDSFICKIERPNLDKRNRPISETKQVFYSEKVTDMKDLNTYNRFKDSFGSRKAQASADEKPTLDHGTKRGLHRTLASVHAAVFAPHVKTLEDAKARHQAVVDLAGAGADEADPKKPTR